MLFSRAEVEFPAQWCDRRYVPNAHELNGQPMEEKATQTSEGKRRWRPAPDLPDTRFHATLRGITLVLVLAIYGILIVAWFGGGVSLAWGPGVLLGFSLFLLTPMIHYGIRPGKAKTWFIACLTFPLLVVLPILVLLIPLTALMFQAFLERNWAKPNRVVSHRPTPFTAQDFDEATQRALYALAYWIAVADGRFMPQEEQWLADQFGTDRSQALRTEFQLYTDEQFSEAVRSGIGTLTDETNQTVLPNLKMWLLSLIHADSFFATHERVVLTRVLRQLGLLHIQNSTGSGRAWRLPFSGSPPRFYSGTRVRLPSKGD